MTVRRTSIGEFHVHSTDTVVLHLVTQRIRWCFLFIVLSMERCLSVTGDCIKCRIMSCFENNYKGTYTEQTKLNEPRHTQIMRENTCIMVIGCYTPTNLVRSWSQLTQLEHRTFIVAHTYICLRWHTSITFTIGRVQLVFGLFIFASFFFSSLSLFLCLSSPLWSVSFHSLLMVCSLELFGAFCLFNIRKYSKCVSVLRSSRFAFVLCI